MALGEGFGQINSVRGRYSIIPDPGTDGAAAPCQAKPAEGTVPVTHAISRLRMRLPRRLVIEPGLMATLISAMVVVGTLLAAESAAQPSDSLALAPGITSQLT